MKRIGLKESVILMVVLSILSYIGYEFNIDTIVQCIMSIFISIACMTNMTNPILSIGCVVITQIIIVCAEGIKSGNLADGIYSAGFIFIVSIIVFIYNIVKARVFKLNKITRYTRKAYRLKPYMHIIIWSLVVMFTTSVMKTDMIESYGFNNQFKAYAALVVVIPEVLLISLLTTSTMTVISLILTTILEIYTVYQLNYINFSIIISLIISIYTLIYVSSVYKGQNRGESNERGHFKRGKCTYKERDRECKKEQGK